MSVKTNKPVIFVGKDVLELLSSSIYVNPLSVFREYIQNAADAIDEAVELGILKSVDEGKIRIVLDYVNRRVVIRDNGCGLSNEDFSEKMVTFGASKKKDTGARGFRGVGRLSSLGYVQQLIFRSRAIGDKKVLEATWNGHKIKEILALGDPNVDLNMIVQEALTINNLNPEGFPPHFFEVELVRPRRIANDKLLNEIEIENYISQVCPCPFAPKFKFGDEISKLLAPHGMAGKYYKIYINNDQNPIFRPYQDYIEYSNLKKAKLHNLKTFKIEGIDGNIAAIVWLIHHEYMGAIPTSLGVKGLRSRIGNIQIGDDRQFIGIFPEDRFCSWTIGEVHVLDSRAIPNSRRDEFEINIHLENIISNLRPLGLEIARKCRLTSQKRNRKKLFEHAREMINEKIDIIVQNAVSEQHSKSLKSDINLHLIEMRKVLEFDLFCAEDLRLLKRQLKSTEKSIKEFLPRTKGNLFDTLPVQERRIYKEMFDLIYECSPNRGVAKKLVDKILDNLGQK
ncbi:MAG: ATP-binding protein [Rhodobacteraceae bacterium]|nr:ATP-binding protein [Paracoccaceae bacterium]MCY4249362.1 ATP-binding protein [Paracoccaceae bacterium]